MTDLSTATPYALKEAVKGGRALRQFLAARDDVRALYFTQQWGVLDWFGRWGMIREYPIERFQAQRQHLAKLFDLGVAIKGGNRTNILGALRLLGKNRRTSSIGLCSNVWSEDFSPEERDLVEAGFYPFDVFQARYTKSAPSGVDYASAMFSAELTQAPRLELVRRNRRTSLHEVRHLRDLGEALRLSLRLGYESLHHIICAGCGEDALMRRSDARYCEDDRCSGRARVRRYRERKAALALLGTQ